MGIMDILAGIAAGALWDRGSAKMTFQFAAATSATAALLLYLWRQCVDPGIDESCPHHHHHHQDYHFDSQPSTEDGYTDADASHGHHNLVPISTRHQRTPHHPPYKKDYFYHQKHSFRVIGLS